MNNWDATAFAQGIREKQLSAEEAVRYCINQIETINPALNAVVSKQYDHALVLAKTGNFSNKVFGGVPILLKDLGQQQEGQLSTSGSRLFASYIAKQTDYLVKTLEDLGFIILGRTNTPEFGFKNISDSQLHGRVNLPDDLTRNAGGSSGGAAASVASSLVPIAMASDGGGSIRIPASFNGLVGLKPTRGRLPVGANSFRGWQGASSNFALTKSIRDTRNLLYHTQICQMESPFILPKIAHSTLFTTLTKSLKIAVQTRSPMGGAVSEEAVLATKEAALFLQSQGHEVVELEQQIVNGVEAMQSYYIMNAVETAAMFDEIENNYGRQMTLDDMELMTWAIYRAGQTIPAKVYSSVLAQWDQYSHVMAGFHETYDLLLTPTTADVAPKHHQFQLSKDMEEQLRHIDDLDWRGQQELIWKMFADSLAWTPFTQQANLTGQPSISLPTYRRADGLSIGIQLTAAKGREDLLLGISELFEVEKRFQLENNFTSK